jgi:hypothetical protein
VEKGEGTQEWGAKVNKAIAAREKEVWRKEVEAKPKLRTYRKLKSELGFESYLDWGDSWRRSLMTKMRGGTNMLRIETGRWANEAVEERKCRVCQTGQVEDEKHFILDCSMYKEVRAKMYRDIDVVMEGKWEGKLRMNDKDWMMDALIDGGYRGKPKK